VKLKGILRKFLKDKNTRFITIDLSTTILMFSIVILATLIFIATMLSGLLVLIIGPIYTHVFQILLIGLIVALSVIFIILLAIKMFFIFSTVRTKNLMEVFCSGGIKKMMQRIAMIFLIICSITFVLFKGSEKTVNTIRDIPHLIKNDYISIDGIIEIKDDTDGTGYVRVDDTYFYEGFAYEPGVINGNKYHVEYLPHSKYIVNFTLIE